ncbi:MAG: ISL3 family transposase [Streptosporangiaceae bacterium]|nr:ISL3 family transposase [Streptosporangiaceae bacterium]
MSTAGEYWIWICLERLLPHLAGIVVEAADLAGGLLRLRARARAGQGVCSRCGQLSGKVHSTYWRRLADAAIGSRRVLIRLIVRRFFRHNPDCPNKTFAEQTDGLTSRRARRTPPLARMLTAIALALAGRAGARLAAVLGLAVSRSGLLRLIMALPDPAPGPVLVLGVDDFAFRRGRDYGTVLVNAGTGRPVDLLRDREADTFADWLKDHPGAEVICRDRAGAYADGARTGAPDAVQVADRWHIYHNLCEHAEKAVARHRDCLKEPGLDLPGPQASDQRLPDLAQLAADAAVQRAEDSALARRTKERYEQVQALRAQGLGIKPIMRQTGLAKETVRRFCRAQTIDELLAKTRDGRPSLPEDYKPYLHQRWNEGCTNVRQLHAELRDRGYRGGYGTIRDYVQPFRGLGAAPPAVPAPPKTRDVTSWILTDPDHLDDDKKAKLAQIRSLPAPGRARRHVTEFAKILTGLHSSRLDDWLTAVEADDQPDLHSFARGIRHDHDAVLNGLTFTWNSGVVEGTVNRIKMIKRQMYGRASFPLLRKRVLLAT